MKPFPYSKNRLKCGAVVSLIMGALSNERAIDVRYREIASQQDFDGVPNYKVMKQLALRRRFGPFYPLLIFLSPWISVALFPYHWILAISGSVGRRKGGGAPCDCRILATTQQNVDLIKSALDVDGSTSELKQQKQSLSCYELGREIGFALVVRSIFAQVRLICLLLGFPVGERRDMILHARDSFALIMMAFDVSRGASVVVTDDHYQRWSYILSHLIKDFRVVQHGFLDANIRFPNSYGTISKLYLRDSLFLEQFERYYRVESSQVFSPKTTFVKTALSQGGLFLASSFPAIDSEIELLRAIKQKCRVPVIVKFHPAHAYDGRRAILAALADMVFDGNGNPACNIFVSYNSFMEFDYRQAGVQTVSISRSGIGSACAQILGMARAAKDAST
ncbi:hypothetical protein ACU8YE_00530 [Ralstonia sp. VS2407]